VFVVRIELDTYIRHDRGIRDTLEDSVPGANVLDPFGQGSPSLLDHFVSVQSYFGNVVQKGEEGREREGGHEEGHEAVLNYCGEDMVLLKLKCNRKGMKKTRDSLFLLGKEVRGNGRTAINETDSFQFFFLELQSFVNN
jgi:hypothetical protein